MDVAALENEIERLPGPLQDRLAAFLTSLRLEREGELPELERRLDNLGPGEWQSWEAAKVDLEAGGTDAG